jgi:hypothetical protein
MGYCINEREIHVRKTAQERKKAKHIGHGSKQPSGDIWPESHTSKRHFKVPFLSQPTYVPGAASE